MYKCATQQKLNSNSIAWLIKKQALKKIKYRKYFLAYLCVCCTLFFICTKAVAQVDSISFATTCAGMPVLFGSSVFDRAVFPDSIHWDFGDLNSGAFNTSASTTPTHVFAVAGTYTITLHVEDNYAGNFDLSRTINFVQPVVVDFGPDITLCQGDSVTLTAPDVAGATYLWNDADSTATRTLTVNESGTFTVKINGCTVTDTAGVFFSNLPMLDLGKDHNMCDSEILTLNAASQNATYKWYLNANLLPDTTAILLTKAPGGKYTVNLDVLGCGAFSDTVNITYSNPVAPTFSLGPDTLLCPKQVYTLSANIPNSTAYDWSTGSKQPSIQVRDAGRYWAFVYVNNQCEVVDTVDIFYRDNKNLDLRDTAICKGSTLILDADFGTGVYHWSSIPPERTDQDTTNQSTLYVYLPGFYMVTAQVGNCIYNDSCNVSFNDSLMLSLFPKKDTTLCFGEQYILTASGNVSNFVWQNGSIGNSFSVTNAGTYYVTAKNGCGADTQTVKIDYRTCDCNLLLPTAFTPNGDGRNDIFRPLHACNMSSFNMRIFNRFGEMLFNSNNPLIGWDGRYMGKVAQQGTYVWVATYLTADGKQRYDKKGTIVLIR